MVRLAVLIWLLAGTVLAGAAVIVVVTVPSLLNAGMRMIPIAGIGGYIVAIPVAWVIARMIAEQSRPGHA